MFIEKMKILEADLSIRDRVYINAKVIYDYQPFDISTSFLLAYKNNHIHIYDIEAKVEYLIFKLNFMNIIKHVLKDYPATYTDDSIKYSIDLPIDSIETDNHTIEVKIK